MNTVPEMAPIPGGNAMSKTFSVDDQNKDRSPPRCSYPTGPTRQTLSRKRKHEQSHQLEACKLTSRQRQQNLER
ncbi:hypothetical protein NC652_022069 [Populus alba x Populus x berolinensis]|nr:hypothetical protein NC652_022069 [Populus alba x Populus x berolinensis]